MDAAPAAAAGSLGWPGAMQVIHDRRGLCSCGLAGCAVSKPHAPLSFAHPSLSQLFKAVAVATVSQVLPLKCLIVS